MIGRLAESVQRGNVPSLVRTVHEGCWREYSFVEVTVCAAANSSNEHQSSPATIHYIPVFYKAIWVYLVSDVVQLQVSI